VIAPVPLKQTISDDPSRSNWRGLQPSRLILRRFFEKFECFADVPNAVTKMRELVLLLSVRGRLSEQCESEACDLQLAKALSFAISNGYACETEPANPPFPIPPSWGWVAVGHL
jgi:hypothetical protein